MNILIIIASNQGTIASCAYQLYKGILKEIPNSSIVVVCYGPYRSDGFHFNQATCLKLGWLSNNSITRIFVRFNLLKKIKLKYNINCSISTQAGPSVWNVLSGIGEYKIGIFHAVLKQFKVTGLKKYISFWLLYKSIFKCLNKKVGVSKKIVEDLKNTVGGDVQLCYNIHDVKHIREQALIDLDDIKEKEIFSKPVVLYVGALYYHIKAPDRLLNAFATFKQNTKDDVQLVYIGQDIEDASSKLMSIARVHNIENSVHFFGKRSNPYKYMKRSRMLVSPSRDEGLPGVVIESCIVGTPCVVTNSTYGNWEIMQCEDLFNKKLSEIVKTDMGCITPNNTNNESFTVKMLAEGMLDTYNRKSFNWANFNTSKYEYQSVVESLFSNM